MKRRSKYPLAIAILITIIVVQGVYILKTKPKKKPILKEAKVELPVKFKGKIAIVIDDWGYNLNNLPLVKAIAKPLTLAILPNLPFSTRIAEEAHAQGLEIILHLPMEPLEKYNLEKNTLITSMDEAKLRNILDQDLATVRYAKGVSNHMGSKFTSDYKAVSIVFSELKKRKLYFLDSFVSSKSVCGEIAKEEQIPFTERDIFLDNKLDAGYIKGQLIRLKNKSALEGAAIGIGHDRKTTLQVLKEELPKMEREGYRLVFVSEVVK